MPTLVVENLTFTFDATVAAGRYDRWDHYRFVWNAPPGGQRAMDVVAVESALPSSVTWLIEAKDFRVITNPPRPSNISTLAETVRDKADHTLAGLGHAQTNALLPVEKNLATEALSTATTRVILHLEPHTGLHTALFPSGFAASVYQKLKRLVRHIDANPLVLNIANTAAANVPWTVS
jgi:hypothetical protein